MHPRAGARLRLLVRTQLRRERHRDIPHVQPGCGGDGSVQHVQDAFFGQPGSHRRCPAGIFFLRWGLVVDEKIRVPESGLLGAPPVDPGRNQKPRDSEGHKRPINDRHAVGHPRVVGVDPIGGCFGGEHFEVSTQHCLSNFSPDCGEERQMVREASHVRATSIPLGPVHTIVAPSLPLLVPSHTRELTAGCVQPLLNSRQP
mmetsp:Transcript_52515/g.139365  ORF Transcript_52515/g.139365 Transcript_52515/m.139365 type:complete len:201 (+) Transcript_52515:1054-1656(+)